MDFYGFTYIAGTYWLQHRELGRAVYIEVTGFKRRQYVRIPPVQKYGLQFKPYIFLGSIKIYNVKMIMISFYRRVYEI